MARPMGRSASTATQGYHTGTSGGGALGARSRRHGLLLLLGGRRCRRQLVGVLQDLVGALPPTEGGALHAAAQHGHVQLMSWVE